jgi:hypothetical protein
MTHFRNVVGADNNKKDRVELCSDDGGDQEGPKNVVIMARDVETTPKEIRTYHLHRQMIARSGVGRRGSLREPVAGCS